MFEHLYSLKEVFERERDIVMGQLVGCPVEPARYIKIKHEYEDQCEAARLVNKLFRCKRYPTLEELLTYASYQKVTE